MIDRFFVLDRLHNLKETYLTKSLSSKDLQILSSDIEDIINRGVRDFIKDTGDTYLGQILDINKQNKFLDFGNGYKGQMYAWLKEHPIITKEIKVCDIEKNNYCEKQKIIQSATLSTAAIIVVYFVSGSIILTLAIGVLGLLLTLYQKKQGKEKDIKTYQDNLQRKMEELVEAIIKEAYDWLEKLEKQSDKVLASFELNFLDK